MKRQSYYLAKDNLAEKSKFTKLIDKIDYPRNVINSFLSTRMSGDSWANAVDKINKGERVYTGSGLIRTAFNMKDKPKSKLGRAALMGGGFGMDVLLDPATYVTFGSKAPILGGKALISLSDDVAKAGLKRGAKLIAKNRSGVVRYFLDPNNLDDLSKMLNKTSMTSADDIYQHIVSIANKHGYATKSLPKGDITKLTAIALNLENSPNGLKQVASIVKEPSTYAGALNKGNVGLVNVGNRHYGSGIAKKFRIPARMKALKRRFVGSMERADKGEQLLNSDKIYNSLGKTIKKFNAKAFKNKDLMNVDRMASATGEHVQGELLDNVSDILKYKESGKFFDKDTLKKLATTSKIKLYREAKDKTGAFVNELGFSPRAITAHEILSPLKEVPVSNELVAGNSMKIVTQTSFDDFKKFAAQFPYQKNDIDVDILGAYENAKKVLQSDLMPKEIKVLGKNIQKAMENGNYKEYLKNIKSVKEKVYGRLFNSDEEIKEFEKIGAYLNKAERHIIESGKLEMPVKTKHGIGYFPHTPSEKSLARSKSGREVGYIQMNRKNGGTLIENIVGNRDSYKAFSPRFMKDSIAELKNTGTISEKTFNRANKIASAQYSDDIINLARQAASSKKVSNFGELLTDKYLPFVRKVKTDAEMRELVNPEKGYVTLQGALKNVGIKDPYSILKRAGVKTGEFDKILIPEGISNQMAEMLKLYQHPLEILGSFAKWTSIWKRYALGSPGTVFRNLIGNGLFLHTKGINILNPHNMGLGKRASKIILNLKSKNKIQLGGIKYADDELVDLAKQHGLLDIGRSVETRPSQIELIRSGGALGAAKTARDHLAGRKGYLNAVSTAMNKVENQGHLWAFMWALDKGYSPEEAARAALDILFDYKHGLTHTERALGSNLLYPFWSFTRFNLPRQLSLLVKRPKTFSRLSQLKSEIEDNSVDKIDEALIPEWLVNRFPIRASKKTVLAGEGFIPSTDLSQILSLKDLSSSAMEKLNPLLKSAYEVPNNMITYFNRPISSPGSSRSPIPFSPKGTMPNVLKYIMDKGFRPAKELNYLVGNFNKNNEERVKRGGYPIPNLPLRTMKVGLGFKPYVLDSDKQAKSAIFKLYKERNELKRGLKRGERYDNWEFSKERQSILDKLNEIEYKLSNIRGKFNEKDIL